MGLANACLSTVAILLGAFSNVPHIRSAAASTAAALSRLLQAADAAIVDGSLSTAGAARACAAVLARLHDHRHAIVGDPQAVCGILSAQGEEDVVTSVPSPSRSARSKRSKAELNGGTTRR